MRVSKYEQGIPQRDLDQLPVSDDDAPAAAHAAATAAAATAAADADAEASAVSDAVLVKVSGIPPGMAEDVVRMIFENKRYGGGDIKTFSQSDNTAVIEFESSAGNTILSSSMVTSFLLSCLSL